MKIKIYEYRMFGRWLSEVKEEKDGVLICKDPKVSGQGIADSVRMHYKKTFVFKHQVTH